MSELVRAVELREDPLSVDRVRAVLADRRSGGLGLFVGTVRDHDGGREVDALTYSAHPSAVDRMREIAETVAADYDAIGVAVVHRVGRLEIGDIAVIAGVAAGHRGPALEACRALIDRVKDGVPIWKHQLFTDGTDEWVGTP